MGKVENNQAMIVRLFAREPDTAATRARCHIGVVDSHVDSAIVRVDQTTTLRRSLVDVGHIAVCRIGALHSSVPEWIDVRLPYIL